MNEAQVNLIVMLDQNNHPILSLFTQNQAIIKKKRKRKEKKRTSNHNSHKV